MISIKKLIVHKRVVTISCFLLITTIIFFAFNFAFLSRWKADKAEYKLIVRTNGYVNNLTITSCIYYFNASTASPVAIPEGINVYPQSYPDSNRSIIEVDFGSFKDEQAIIVLSNIEPISSIPIDESSAKFSGKKPDIRGDLKNCTNFFFHFSISANTPIGRINVNSYSIEAVTKDGELIWNDWPQSKERTFTVSLWTFILLSATISSIFVTLASVWLTRKTFQTFPIATFSLASVMCITYLFVGVGNDLLSSTNMDFGFRLLLSILSPIFHSTYRHLMNNLLYSFLIGGTLVEIWFPSLRRYFWFLSPLPLSIVFSVLTLFSPNAPFLCVSIGSSFWCIGISLLLARYVFQKRPKLVSIYGTVAILLSGYLLFSSIWNYMASLFIGYYSDTTRSLSLGHLLFAVLYLIFAFVLPFLLKTLRTREQ